MIYRLDHTPELRDVTLDVRAAGGRIRYRISGPAPLGFRTSVLTYFAWFNLLRPVRVSGDSYIYSLYIPPIPSGAHNHQLENHLRARTIDRRTPMAATLAVTDACQLKCVHCSAALRPHDRPPLDTATWKRVIGECVGLGTSVVTFTGGEPLLRRDLDELIAAVPKDRAVAEFFCNGLDATPERLAAARQAGAYGIHLSLDDPDETEHDRGRGREGVYRAVADAARAARAAGLLVGLSTYATSASVDARKLTRVAALGEEWGASEISVFDGIRTGRMLRGCEPLLDDVQRRLPSARRSPIPSLLQMRPHRRSIHSSVPRSSRAIPAAFGSTSPARQPRAPRAPACHHAVLDQQRADVLQADRVPGRQPPVPHHRAGRPHAV